jgi:hypothetical protein
MRRILAHYDASGIDVYQAFKPAIVAEAVRLQHFGKGFGLDRISWIKPSWGWMLHRSEYATKHRQEAIVRVRLSHEGFLSLLAQAVSTQFEPSLYGSEDEWRRDLSHTQVRYQWDPDRDLEGRPQERRALQLGLEGEALRQYATEYIVATVDETARARALREAIRGKKPWPETLPERDYALPDEIARRLCISPLSTQ